MKKYYLLSIKHSKYDQYSWWGPNDSGYTANIQTAGIYTEEQINSRKNYYSNKGVMPVPVEVVEQAVKTVVIPNIDKNSELFKIQEHLKTAIEF